jgi:heat shock protein HslJ
MTRLLVLTLALGTLLIGCATPAGSLTNTTWKWSASTTTSPASQTNVPNPDNYTINFKPNNTFDAKADCNQVSGSWSTDNGNSMTIKPGPSTLAACGPASLGSQFVAGLSQATNYVLDSNGMTLTLGTAGTMTFHQ